MKRILLVEDDPFLIDIYCTKLNESGLEVHLAKDGEDVVDLSKKIRPDIIILDIVLPHVDGWQILKQLKTEETLKMSKIIILSNLSQKEEVEKGISLGADKYLIKSDYTPTEVVEEIKKIL